MSSEKREIQVVAERVLCIDPAVVAILDLDTDVSEAARTVAKLAKEDFFYYAAVPSPSHARHTSHTRPLSSSQPVLLKTQKTRRLYWTRSVSIHRSSVQENAMINRPNKHNYIQKRNVLSCLTIHRSTP